MRYENLGQEIFINRELSWLDFNARVLDEAGYKANSLLDRLNFISIFCSNLDEFFMLRIAGLRQLLDAANEKQDAAGFTPEEQLFLLREKVVKLLKRQCRYFTQEILPELEKHKLRIRKPKELSEASQKELKHIFQSQIFSVLTPIAIDPEHPFPMFNNGAIEIVINMMRQNREKSSYAFVEVPQVLPRFILVEDNLPGKTYILLEDLIMENLPSLFAQTEIIEVSSFRIIRDMDFAIHESQFRDFLNCIEKTLLECRSREPICLIISSGTSKNLKNWLYEQFKLDELYIYSIPDQFALGQFSELVEKESSAEFNEPQWPPLRHPDVKPEESIFKAINDSGFICLMTPYHSFAPITRLLEEAAVDPEVLAIKQTLYRVSGDSPIVKALQEAAQNGKQVTVIVELKARFDEDNNILWARRLEESGAHVIYGISGLKIHCKALIIIRKEEGIIKRYVHLGTGNYNDKTARSYADTSIMTNDNKLCADISALFNLMTGYSEPSNEWHKITIAPFDLRQKFITLIDREAKHSTPDDPGHIIAKMNSLVDPEIIKHLYKAAFAGVKIELIVRGICCLRPGIETKNIKVISIIDRFLEHSRIYYFANNGQPEYYLSSADWMPRNLDRRIELLFPVEHAETCGILKKLLEFQLNDKEKGRVLRSDGTYTRHFSSNHSPCRSQYKIYHMLKKIANQANNRNEKHFKILTSENVLNT
jgi:polyphosphate kinase